MIFKHLNFPKYSIEYCIREIFTPDLVLPLFSLPYRWVNIRRGKIKTIFQLTVLIQKSIYFSLLEPRKIQERVPGESV